jgi:hypothetical protein
VVSPSRRRVITAVALAAASVGLAIVGWDYPLTPSETAHALEARHRNYSGPVICHAVGGGDLMRRHYNCNFREFPRPNDSFLLDVNDSRIVLEYP